MTSIAYRPYPTLQKRTFLWIFIGLSILAHVAFMLLGDTQSVPKSEPKAFAPLEITLSSPQAGKDKLGLADTGTLKAKKSKAVVSAPAVVDDIKPEVATIETLFQDPTAESTNEESEAAVAKTVAKTEKTPLESTAGIVASSAGKAKDSESKTDIRGAQIEAAAYDWIQSQAMTRFETELGLLDIMLGQVPNIPGYALRNAYVEPDGLTHVAFSLGGGKSLCAETRAPDPLDSFDLGFWRVSANPCSVQ